MISNILEWLKKWSLKEVTTTIIALMILGLNVYIFKKIIGWNYSTEINAHIAELRNLAGDSNQPLTQAEYLEFIDEYGSSRFTQLKDLLVIATGFLGVILGYYFGRIPAEKALENAQGQIDSAKDAETDAKTKANEARKAVHEISLAADEGQAGKLAKDIVSKGLF